uniref:Mpv17/PMP22 family protein n=1 Tax=viral metagenome TaxID=1070528 RepID=A0A6C0EB84_9ZZZZ
MALLLRAFNNAMIAKPMLTTSIATGFCYGTGDGLAQTIDIKKGNREHYDTHRLLVFTLFGISMAGPIYYTWFRKIDTMPKLLEGLVKWNQTKHLTREFRKQLSDSLHKGNIENMSMKQFRQEFKNHFDTFDKPIIRSKTILVAKVYADQFIFSSLYPIFFFMTTGVLLANTKKEDFEYIKQNKNLNYAKINKSIVDSWENLKKKYLTIYIADCAVWPMAQMANFAFIPVAYQALYVNSLNILWNAFICYVSQEGY